MASGLHSPLVSAAHNLPQNQWLAAYTQSGAYNQGPRTVILHFERTIKFRLFRRARITDVRPAALD